MKTKTLIVAFLIIILAGFSVYTLLKKDTLTPSDTDFIGNKNTSSVSPIPINPTGEVTQETATRSTKKTQRLLFDDQKYGFIPIPPTESKDTSVSYVFDFPEPLLDPDTMIINTSSGFVETNDVLINPEKVLAGDWGVVVKRTPQYSIVYYTADQGFVISIEDVDVVSARSAVESNLISLLGISAEDACKLNVSLSVPRDVNTDLAGTNYRLSFCPNGVAF